MFLIISLSVGLFTLLLAYFNYERNYWKRREIPHDDPYLIYGNMKEFRATKAFPKIIADIYDKYKGTGPFAGFYFFSKRALIILDVELIKNVLIKDFNNFHERGLFHNERDDPLTATLFSLDGEKWRQMRYKISPTFTSGKLRHMCEAIAQVSSELSTVLGEKIKSENCGGLEISELMDRYTADIIGVCAFGLEFNSLRNSQAKFIEMANRANTETRHNKLIDSLINGHPRLARKLGMRVIPQSVHEFYLRIVRETLAFREQNKVKRNDYMDMLIELKKSKQDPMTVGEMAAQAFVFLTAGFEPSGKTMGFVLYELARYQDVQDRARAEVRSVLAKHNNVFSYECMKEMKYLEMIYSETLRMHPAVSDIIRLANQRYETSDPKYFIEAGTMIIVSVLGVHHDPDIYPEPEKFKPERFTADAIKQRPACTWLPFGDGPRNCIGMRFAKMQIVIGMAHLLKDFRFSVSPETEIPLTYGCTSFFLSPANGIYLKVEKV